MVIESLLTSGASPEESEAIANLLEKLPASSSPLFFPYFGLFSVMLPNSDPPELLRLIGVT